MTCSRGGWGGAQPPQEEQGLPQKNRAKNTNIKRQKEEEEEVEAEETVESEAVARCEI